MATTRNAIAIRDLLASAQLLAVCPPVEERTQRRDRFEPPIKFYHFAL